MRMKRCENGHRYDPQQYSACPSCRDQSQELEKTRPQPVDHAFVSADNAPTASRPGEELDNAIDDASAGSSPDDADVTRGLIADQIGFDPVVGWLMCIDGPDKGQDYRIRSAKNRIGRSAEMDIFIQGDNTISRRTPAAIVSFDSQTCSFALLPVDEWNELVYLNDKAIYTPTALQAYDMIRLGRTHLIFVPLCGDQFQWNQ